jgi:hypothetical protein
VGGRNLPLKLVLKTGHSGPNKGLVEVVVMEEIEVPSIGDWDRSSPVRHGRYFSRAFRCRTGATLGARLPVQIQDG